MNCRRICEMRLGETLNLRAVSLVVEHSPMTYDANTLGYALPTSVNQGQEDPFYHGPDPDDCYETGDDDHQ